ncbi:three-Cys-motif partner protein TcmP [Kordia sp. YSTF-M3]|uniref:Three-Cys-motif partner protein TcmP n=1 Tax=Kordia aestuariivivens TaxID=2759037 RepID=A0ABR7Q5Z6_9FLAO|nr:three-Cys-motif partner protein TcmP [Kordia aestuariivivens]MBC8753980.1 three-Cys-motif partner protein TcmP [Kordia aestuariivivens]
MIEKRNLHTAPFDIGTQSKLAIFNDYIKEWLPVFLAKKEIYWDTINIFDFFSGPGMDVDGNKGTPLLIIDELESYLENIERKKLKVNLYFNDYSSEKIEILKNNLKKYSTKPYSIKIQSQDFKDAFRDQYPKMENKNAANLLLLDQTGVKQIDENIFQSIVKLKTTDFLFFISSSTIKRFKDNPSITRHINIDSTIIEDTKYDQIHRLVTEYYKNLIPNNIKYYISSFSLKKKAGLYGIIFGSGNPFGIEKFLRTSWKIDPIRGEANFDIDNDNIVEGQVNIFTGKTEVPKKVELFEQRLKENILNSKLNTDKDVYLYTLINGFKPEHAKEVIKHLIKEKKIEKLKLNISYKVCKKGEVITQIKLN